MIFFCNFAPSKTKIIMSSIKRIEVIMVLLLCIAVGALAQSGGGVFGRGNTQEQADDFGAMGRGGSSGSYNLHNQQFGSDGYELHNQTFGQDAPLGSGWLVLTLAGAAYASKKRKNNIKKQQS